MNIKMESRILGILSEKDHESRITRCNPVFLEYAGVESDNQILGLTDYDFPWQEYADTYRQHELEVLAGNSYSIVFPFKTSTGDYSIFLHSKAARYNEAQEIIGIQCHAIEIINPDVHRMFAHLLQRTPQENQSTGFTIGKKHHDVQLTRREKDIVFFLCKAKTAKQIAQILHISPRTIYSHIEHIKVKLNCHTKSELIDMAYQLGLAQELPSVFL